MKAHTLPPNAVQARILSIYSIVNVMHVIYSMACQRELSLAKESILSNTKEDVERQINIIVNNEISLAYIGINDYVGNQTYDL
jgi:hypothetical protein